MASPNGDAQEDAKDNLSVSGDGFDRVIKAKQAVEAVCPGVVSCADILAIAARDVVVLSGGPSFTVELSRLDGQISQASRATSRPRTSDSNLLAWNFRKNLSFTLMIAFSGAHTVVFLATSRATLRTPADAGVPAESRPFSPVNMDPTTLPPSTMCITETWCRAGGCSSRIGSCLLSSRRG